MRNIAALVPVLLHALCGAAVAEPLNVCLIANAGWAECDAAKDPSTYTGLDVELFRTAAIRAGWMEGVAYRFVCWGRDGGWSALARQLAANGTMGTCAVGSGAFALTAARRETGVQFSYPYYRTGLGVLMGAGSEEINPFAFFKPFHLGLWLAIIATITLVPLLTWAVEEVATRGSVLLDAESLRQAHMATYESMLAVFNLCVHQVRSLPAQLLVVVFCFLVMITVATYVANLAAVLASYGLSERFTGMLELRGRAVAAHGTYTRMLQSSYGVEARQLDFDGPGTFRELRSALTNGSLDAYVMDLPEIGYFVMAANDDCAVRLMRQTYGLLDFGFLFHKDVPGPALTAFNAALFLTLESNLVEQLAGRYLLFLGALDRCATAVHDAVEFKQLAGLWIMVAGGVGFAAVSCAVSVARRLTSGQLPEHQRKLSSVFVSGARAQSLRSMASASLHGGGASLHGGGASLHGGGGGSLAAAAAKGQSVHGGGAARDAAAAGKRSEPEASLLDSSLLSIKVRPASPALRSSSTRTSTDDRSCDRWASARLSADDAAPKRSGSRAMTTTPVVTFQEDTS